MDIALFCGLMALSAFFSASETALFSIGKVARTRLGQSDRRLDRMLAQLIESPRQLLVVVLFGNELTNVALSIVSATIVSGLTPDRPLAEQALLSSVIVIPAVLIFGEITPKTIAALKPEAVGRVVAGPLSIFARAVTPFRILIQGFTDALTKRLGHNHPGADDTIDEQELRTLVEVGTESGIIERQERALIINVLDFGDRSVGQIMTPGDRICAVSIQSPIHEIIELAKTHQYSRIPVWDRDPQKIVGVVFAKDLLAQRWGLTPARNIRGLMRRPYFVPPHMQAEALLEELRKRRTHMAVVVNEFGLAVGLCTMEDLLEEVFGPITDTASERKGEEAQL
ncbi:MAG: hemolysin family protein [Bradymonadia bacterium]